MKKYFNTTIIGLVILGPRIALAQTGGLKRTIEIVSEIVANLSVLAMGLATLFFLWGLVKFIRKAGDSAAQEEGKNIMLWGVIALFVMFSLWGLVRLVQNTFEIKGAESALPLPEFPNQRGN